MLSRLQGAILAMVLLPVGVSAQESEVLPGPSASRSLGAANHGRLEDGVQLDETRGLRLRSGPGGRWGTAELVGLIQRAAARVQDEEPGPPLLVGHLSGPRGGPLRPHESHQSGRDADLGFYVTDENGVPMDVDAMVRLDERGCGRSRNGPVCIDGRRTFMLLAAMVEDPVARVQWVLLSPGVREQVLASGRRSHVSDEVLSLVQEITRPRHGSEAHDDHIHVRIYCPVDDRPRCRDRAPFHRLYEGDPP
ncbi:MAG: penicillin-insensitive murein endopeptidase [Sandaracinaceae bacterium]